MDNMELTKLMAVLHNLKFEFEQLQKMTDRPVIRRIWKFICWSELEYNIEKAHSIVHNELETRANVLSEYKEFAEYSQKEKT